MYQKLYAAHIFVSFSPPLKLSKRLIECKRPEKINTLSAIMCLISFCSMLIQNICAFIKICLFDCRGYCMYMYKILHTKRYVPPPPCPGWGKSVLWVKNQCVRVRSNACTTFWGMRATVQYGVLGLDKQLQLFRFLCTNMSAFSFLLILKKWLRVYLHVRLFGTV